MLSKGGAMAKSSVYMKSQCNLIKPAANLCFINKQTEMELHFKLTADEATNFIELSRTSKEKPIIFIEMNVIQILSIP